MLCAFPATAVFTATAVVLSVVSSRGEVALAGLRKASCALAAKSTCSQSSTTLVRANSAPPTVSVAVFLAASEEAGAAPGKMTK